MVVKKEMKSATKPKVGTKVTVKLKKVNEVIDRLVVRLRGIKYGYVAKPEIRELKELFK